MILCVLKLSILFFSNEHSTISEYQTGFRKGYCRLYFHQLVVGVALENVRDKLESELHVYYKLIIILYADDTVILSESKDGL